MLAFLLEEEQFVEVANHLMVATNAVEYSLADEVDRLLPLVKDHRYAAYIDSYRYNQRREVDKLQDVMGDLRIEDPRMNSQVMFFRCWAVKNKDGNSIGAAAFQAAHRNFTMPAMLEYIFYSSEGNPIRVDQSYLEIFANEVSTIAPHSDVGMKLRIIATQKPPSEQLDEWQDQLKEDPNSFLFLAVAYQRIDDIDGAIRCYERSYELLPTFGAAFHLSRIYRDHEDYEKWEQTLLDFLQTESHGLEHATVHTEMAYVYRSRGLWKKARPHAIAAAETGSLFGMKVASQISEGLAEWEESEQWIRGVSSGYPSAGGFEWYFWCRRTGRGDVESAAKLADEFFAAPLRGQRQRLEEPVQGPGFEDYLRRGDYHFVRGDFEKCLEAYRHDPDASKSFTRSFMIAQLSRQMGDKDAFQKAVDAIDKTSIGEEPDIVAKDPNVIALGRSVLEIIENRRSHARAIGKYR